MNKEIDQFWLDNYEVLYKNNNYIRFIPQASMTKIQQLNAITRFSIYAFILILLFEKNNKWLYVPIMMVTICIVLYKVHIVNLLEIKDKMKDNNKKNNLNIIDIDNSKDNEHHLIQFQDKQDLSDIQQENFNNTTINKEIDKKIDDYDKDIILPKEKKCTEPTRDNPFMNFMLSDYSDEPNRSKACSSNVNNELEIKDINQKIDLNFNYNLYKDIDDIFEKKNSQRQFYTMPNTDNPNDQKSFAEWLYKIPETCKTDQLHCLKYEDIRYKR